MTGFATTRRIWGSRQGFCGIRRRQEQSQSRDATQCCHTAPIFLISVTFSLPAPKAFHHQGRFLLRIIIFVKSVRGKRSFQLLVFGQVVLPSWMIFKSEMVGLNDSLGIPIAAGAPALRLAS